MHLDDADFLREADGVRCKRRGNASPALRPELLAAAERQIKAGEEAYDRLAGFAETDTSANKSAAA